MRARKIFAITSVIFASIFGAICFSSSSASATVTASITTSSSINLKVKPFVAETDIEEKPIIISSSCSLGYNLTVATSESPDFYLDGDNTNPSSITTVDGTSALDSANNTNKWGYTLTNNASGSTVFSPLSTTPSTLRTVSGTSGTTGETFFIYYGVKVDVSVARGIYKMSNDGDITYYLTMNPLCYTANIVYDGNNASAGTMEAVHSDVRDGDTIDLIASNFSKTGYGFAGWSLDPDAGAKLIDNDTTNNPIVYGPQETITLPVGFVDNADSNGEIKLYAVWIPSQGNLQGWTGCSTLDTATYDSNTGALDITKNSITALTDQRDNDTYAVARLADGNCWMIENLRLDADATTGNNTTDPAVTNEWLSQGYAESTIYGNFAGLATSESPWDTDSSYTTANSLYSINGAGNTINIGASNAAFRFPRYNDRNTSSRGEATAANQNIYSYGNYYTWAAAIADLNMNDYTGSDLDINTSLCPAGWHLPKGGDKSNESNNEFWSLIVTGINNGTNPANYDNIDNPYYHNTPEGTNASMAIRAFPNNFLYSGVVRNNSIYERGSYGHYWTSTVASSSASYTLKLYKTFVYPGTNDNDPRSTGNNIRCVSSSSETYTLTYDANGGSDAPSSQTTSAIGVATFTVSSATPTRSGYTFAGWMDEKGNEVQAGGTFKTKDVNATLYAIWTNSSCNPTATTIGTGNTSTDAVCLQDVKPSMKASLPTATSTTGTYNLIDARDGQTYTVAKLADGELWLTKNLNYGSSNDTLLTSYDTDIPYGTTFKAPAITTDFETTNTAATYVIPKILTDSTYGGYYSFAAAIASTAAYTSSQEIATSICPKGWDLPSRTQYVNLRDISGNTTYSAMNAVPYSFIYAGYRDGTSFTNQTSNIRLWTSTNYNVQYAYYATAFGITSFTNYKRYGESVRCVAGNGTATINYDANGGSGTMPSQTNADIGNTNISPNSFTAPAGSQFREWNTSADGTGTTVTVGAPLSSIASDGDTITLYAQWDEVYFIAFDANGGSGSMSNQTVIRDTATNINTNSFTRSGYFFYGWNTSADGSGTLYTDGQRITNLTSAGSTITLYAIWSDAAYLDTGQNVNQKLKRLAGNSSANYSSADDTITAIVRSNSLPNDFTPTSGNTISHSSSLTPIYAWYDSTNTTIYYYSTASSILMNSDSSYLFQYMRALSDLSTISTWDTIKVTDMSRAFSEAGYNATTFTADLSSWNTSNVTNMKRMFASTGLSATTWSIGDLSSWNTANVTNMEEMFLYAGRNATTWSVGNLSSWNTLNVTSMLAMFSFAGYSATSFNLDLSSWKTPSVTDMSEMFHQAGYSATTWSIGDLSSWDTSSVTSMFAMFNDAGHSATSWSIGNISSWNTLNVTNMRSMFDSAGYSATNWSIGNLSSWKTLNVTNMSHMFYCAGFSATAFNLNLSSWKTSSVTDMSDMFAYSGRLTKAWSVGDISSWNTSNVTNMNHMFEGAAMSATTFALDLSSWNTSSVTNMNLIFSYAGYSATTFSVNLSSWDTSNVTNTASMFSYAGYRATTFTLDLSSWNTSGVTNMNDMFRNAGRSATTWSVTIPKTNDGTASGPISNTTSNLYGNTTSVTATPDSGKSFTLQN